MQLAHDKEELITNLDQARMMAKKIDYTIGRMVVDISRIKFQYNPYQNIPKWLENQLDQLSIMTQELDKLSQNI